MPRNLVAGPLDQISKLLGLYVFDTSGSIPSQVQYLSCLNSFVDEQHIGPLLTSRVIEQIEMHLTSLALAGFVAGFATANYTLLDGYDLPSFFSNFDFFTVSILLERLLIVTTCLTDFTG